MSLGGYAGQQLSKPSTHQSELIGLAAATVILLFAFGTATAMALPIITALIGLLSALSLIKIVGLVVDVPTVAPTLATMIGLGVGIDYALFIVTRHKLQLRDGMEMNESVARATATSGGAVLFAGTTVVIALGSLAFAGIPLVTTLGYTAAIAVVVAVLGAVTLLPALLGALGPRIHSLRVKLGRTHPDDHRPHGWARWARWVARRPGAPGGEHGRARDPGAAGAQPAPRASRTPARCPSRHGAAGLRRARHRLRRGHQRPAAGGGEARHSRPSPTRRTSTRSTSSRSSSNEQQQQIEQQALLQGATQQQAKPRRSSRRRAVRQARARRRSRRSPPPPTRASPTLSDDLAKAPDVKSVSPPTLDKSGKAAVYTVISDSAALLAIDRGSRRTICARPRSRRPPRAPT